MCAKKLNGNENRSASEEGHGYVRQGEEGQIVVLSLIIRNLPTVVPSRSVKRLLPVSPVTLKNINVYHDLLFSGFVE